MILRTPRLVPPLRHRAVAVAGVVIVALVLAGCGSSSKSTASPSSSSKGTATPSSATPSTASGSSPTTSGTSGNHSGTVDVLYAGSLVALMEKQIGPGFQTATGYKVDGFAAGTTDLVSDIKGKVQRGDVFISASPSANGGLEGAANGNWVSWYVSFATSPLLLGYNPKSRFAAQLRTKPWWQVVSEPGFRLGYTPPATDPKGVLAVEALHETATKEHLPALDTIASDSKLQFPEQDLVGQLQSGNLDAGFFYAAEAHASNLLTVPLSGITLSAGYTVTILSGAPHPAEAAAFLKYFFSPQAAPLFKQDGFDLLAPPTTSGAVPASVRADLPTS